LSDVRIPYKVNTSISTMRFVQQITHNKSQTKITKGLLHLLVGLNNGEVFKFSEDGLLQQTKKLTEEPITHITKNFATTKNKIYSMTNYKLMSEKYVCNGFHESTNSDEVYVAEVSHVMILSGRLEEKAQVNIPGEKLVWGDSGIVVTAGRTLNIGDLNGHTKSISLSSQAQSIGCQLNRNFLDIIVNMVSQKCFFVRFDLSNGVKSATEVSSANIDFDLESVGIFGSRIRGVKNQVIYELSYQDQANTLASKFTFEPVVSAISNGINGSATSGAKKGQTAILGRSNQALPGAKYRLLNIEDDTKADQVADQSENETQETIDINGAVPQIQISGALIRALERGNVANLEKIVEVDNQDLITKTVKQIPNYLCIAFLDNTIRMYASRAYSAKSCATLLKWIQTIFTVKATFFMGRRDILEIASPLYNILDAKIDSLNSLLDLSGRLDLVLELSGVAAVNDAERTSSKKVKQDTVYESDEEDDMNQFIERYHKGKIDEDEDEFDVIDEEQQQEEEDKKDGSAYQDSRGIFDTADQDPDEMSDDDIELEKALQHREKELLGKDGDDVNEDDYEDDYEDDEQGAENGEAMDDDEEDDHDEEQEESDDE